MVNLLNTIYQALNNAFVPFMFDDLAGRTSESVKQSHFRNYYHLFTLGTCAFALMSPEVLKVMSTEAYWPALDVLPLLTVGQYSVYMYSFPVNYEFYRMRTSSIAVGTALAAALNTALNVALIPSHGMYGAAFATMCAYLALFVFHFCMARYRMGDRNYPARYYAIGLAAVTVAAACYYPLSEFVMVRWTVGLILLVAAFARVVRTRSIF